jgi:hypothetical protein
MERCPICSNRVESVWEVSDGGCKARPWFTGLYTCRFCGHIRASGVGFNGERRVVEWHPGCPDHGTEYVFQTNDVGTEYCCGICARRMKVEGEKVVTTWQPWDSGGVGRFYGRADQA